MSETARKTARPHPTISLFLCGDVMTGRGIDQVLPHPGDPVLYESYVRDARQYVELAESLNGPISRPMDFAYPWGDALDELQRMAPDVRIINLETSVTTSNACWPDKAIHYRMQPDNIPCLTVAAIDCCVLANNHVLDWGYEGLQETLQTLHDAGVETAGAGRDLNEAQAPAVLELPGKGRVLVFAFGMESSGVNYLWAASAGRAGVNLLPDLSGKTARQIGTAVRELKRAGDIVIISIHWGGNWGYAIPSAQIRFAHELIDNAGVDLIHGHSSHHAKGIEVYKDRPILYGCGDFVTDYEGIAGQQEYRGDLGLMYFLCMEPSSGKLVGLRIVPLQTVRFSLQRASKQDRFWLRDRLNREGRQFGTRVRTGKQHDLLLEWRDTLWRDSLAG